MQVLGWPRWAEGGRGEGWSEMDRPGPVAGEGREDRGFAEHWEDTKWVSTSAFPDMKLTQTQSFYPTEMGKFNLVALVSMETPIGLALAVRSESKFYWKLCLGRGCLGPPSAPHHLCLSFLQMTRWRPGEA